MLHIDLRSDGRRILVPIKILKPDGFDLTSVSAMALLDTGATTSGITLQIAEQLNLEPMGKRPMGSARGLDQVERYGFRVGVDPSNPTDIPAFPYVFPTLLGFEIVRGSSFQALIGMDILRQCAFSLARDGRARLEFD